MTATCVLHVAGPGWGKTAALAAVGPVRPAASADPAQWGEGSAPVVLDDLDALSVAAQRRLAAALPDQLEVHLASATPLDPSVRAALRRPVRERGPADLALDVSQVARLLRDEHGVSAVDAAVAVHTLTAGWPALVQLAADAAPAVVRAGAPGDLTGRLARHLDDAASPTTAWLRARVLAPLPPRVARALASIADLDPVADDLLGDLAAASAWLRRTGLVVPHPRHPGTQLGQVVPVVAAAVRRSGPAPDRPDRSALSGWYLDHGLPFAAASLHARAGDVDAVTALVETQGRRMLAAGHAAQVAALPVHPRRGALLVTGDARRMAGDPSGARRVLQPLFDARPDAAAAWRLAMVAYLVGDLRETADVCARATPTPSGREDVDDVLLLGLQATVSALSGEPDSARGPAQRALEVAERLGDDTALAVAHLALALTSGGTRRGGHLALALAAAHRAGDVVLAARVLVDQSHELLQEARFTAALEVAADAVRAADLGSPPGLLTAALCNHGEALLHTGYLDDAAFRFEHAIEVCQHTGLGRLAVALRGRGDVARWRGRTEPALAAYEEAVDIADDRGDVREQVLGRARLARALGDVGETDRAVEVAALAEKTAPPDLVTHALVARGWVALAHDDLGTARTCAVAATAPAQRDRTPDALAEAWELLAAVDGGTAPLEEALALWTGAGARVDADRVRVLLARTPGAGAAARSAGREAARRLLDLGVLPPTRSAGEGVGPTVAIRVLGEFSVTVHGRPVPLPAWKSRQARTLVKVLVARRGRVVPRPELRELLWPDDDPSRTAHRLSVLLSVVRSVLDPQRALPADHHVTADAHGIALDLTHVRVDVEDFLREAAEVLGPAAGPVDPLAERAALAEIDAAYTGDALPDEVYEDWADPLREAARAAWLAVLTRLVAVCRATGAHDQAAHGLVRLLAADPYDETSHRLLVRTLVGARRHGEARRAFERWCAAMQAIDAPVPDPAVLSPR